MALGITASPLSCQCGAVTITATGFSLTPSRWAVFLFYKSVITNTPFYSAPLTGNYLNPTSDTYWDVILPMNANYTFYSIALMPFDLTLIYSAGDWAYNPIDGNIYISIAGSNIGQVLDNQVWWKRLDLCDYQGVPIKTANGLASSFEVSTLSLPVTCNTSFIGLNIDIDDSCESSVQTLAFTDNTGKFSFQSNPNGYGGLNPYRGDYAQMLILTNAKSDGTFTEFQSRIYSYRSATKYYFDIPRDGLYVLNVFLVQLFGNKASYNKGEAVFNEVLNSFYVSLLDVNTDAVTVQTSWTPIIDYAGFTSSSYYSLTQDYFIQDANGRKLLYDLKEGIKTSCPCACNAKCGDDLMKKWLFVTMCIEDACFSKQLFKYAEAQCFLEKIPKNCSPYISAFKC